jgi:hypothetical protein
LNPLDCPGSFTEITNIILSKFCSVRDLAMMARTNKNFRHYIRNNYHIWLEVASRTTGFNASKYCVPYTDDFFQNIRLLLCPWHAVMQRLPFNVPETDTLTQRGLRSISPERLVLALKDNNDEV